jgi:hypothetical protein
MRRLGVPILVVLCAAVFAATALAAVQFQGKAKFDARTKVSFQVVGNTSGGKFQNGRVSQIRVENQRYTCFDKNGNPRYSGRTTYLYQLIKPADINSNNHFRGVYKSVASGHVLQRLVFQGTITRNRRGKFVAAGTFRSQVSEGGIEFGYCGNKRPVQWVAHIPG